MTHVNCRLTVKNRDQLRNPTLGNRVWATFTFQCPCGLHHITARNRRREKGVYSVTHQGAAQNRGWSLLSTVASVILFVPLSFEIEDDDAS